MYVLFLAAQAHEQVNGYYQSLDERDPKQPEALNA